MRWCGHGKVGKRLVLIFCSCYAFISHMMAFFFSFFLLKFYIFVYSVVKYDKAE